MKKLIVVPVLLAGILSFSQSFQPTWESLDSRPVPQWFSDAKFGIFIHWGVYAVPGWCTKGNYAEWYQYGLETGDTARIKFHKEKFGNRTYYDLANDFKAELFNPDEWAGVFEQSGAKYIVLTSKHHDGFCLWPSKEAGKTWGFPWNAVETGPKRDLLGDLFAAVRKTSVHAGMYYSLYEWFNPLWKSNKVKYVSDHVWPQMKELVNRYRPDVFWTDGDWELSEDVWKSRDFLTWLYNESPVKEKIVTYDRWGSDVRFRHGAVFTPEYQPLLDFEDHYWEESRGMGYSYGYNREEDAWDYNSTQSLVLHLVDKVSRGGNFLLDIGPDEHGKIPPIMQERLLQMGDWLKINGEAIYSTTRWLRSSQWSEGKRDYEAKGGDVMLKLTVDPEPGYGSKEVFFTYNANTNSLYVIFPRYPDNKKLLLKDITLQKGSIISFLSTHEELLWKQEGNDLVIELPGYNPNKIKAPYAYTVKIGNYGKFAAKPIITITYKPASLNPVVQMETRGAGTIHYTTDGTEPLITSSLYSAPFTPDKTVDIKARVFVEGILPGAVAVEKAIRYEWQKAMKTENLKPGIVYRYYEPSGKIDMNSIGSSPVVNGVAETFTLSPRRRPQKFAFEFTGYIKIPRDNMYSFYIASDDGSKLFIDGRELVNNDGDHGSVEKRGDAALQKGMHSIKVQYFDSGGDNSLKLSMNASGESRIEIPASILYH